MRPNLLVVAHPDDETIGLGGQLHAFENLSIVHVTDGAPRSFPAREEHAAVRRRELLAALGIAGIAPERATCLGVADQEASLDLAGLTARIAGLFRELAPHAVYTHPYEGGHPDHDACAFAVHAACGMVDAPPAIREFTSYHCRGGAMVTGEFLCARSVTTVLLSRVARARKQRMIECFRTQRETLRPFRCDAERIRAAPRYDFSRLPAQEILYDHYSWGVKSAEWIERARAALAALCP